jgi:diguanylate cyclase (GGDEF)-like protein
MFRALRLLGVGVSGVMTAGDGTQVLGFAVSSKSRPGLVIVRYVTRDLWAVGADSLFDGFAKVDPSSAYFLVDSRGQVASSSRGADRTAPIPGYPASRANPLRSTLGVVNVRGTANVLLVSPVPEIGWLAAYEQPRDRFYAGLDGKGRLTLAAIALLLVVVIAAGIISAHLRQQNLRRGAEQLLYIATHDSLTGLANRARFVNDVEQSILRAARHNTKVAVLYLDVDRFKPINDNLGHAAGDEVLRLIGTRLHAAMREVDVAARLGGDEFAVLLEGVTSFEQVQLVADRLRESIAAPVTVAGAEMVIQVSIGTVVSDAAHFTCDDLLAAADLAMYQVKDSCREPVRNTGHAIPEARSGKDRSDAAPPTVVG